MSKPTFGEMRTRAERIADEKVKSAVVAGLAALREEYGDDWVEKIDCQSLDLRDNARCVLGQVCGSYDAGLQLFVGGLDQEWAAEHGFYVDTASWYEGYSDSDFDLKIANAKANKAWDTLDGAWHEVLCDGFPPIDYAQAASDMPEKLE